jgi:hypothetical protein
MLYVCKCCRFMTELKPNYKRHLITNKHKKLCQTKITNLKDKNKNEKEEYSIVKTNNVSEINNNSSEIKCNYCNRIFKHKSSLSKHIKYSCKKNKDEDFKELVRLLNEQNILKEQEINEMKLQNKSMQKQIDKLTNKLQIQHISNNTVNYNINLLNYDKTDYSHLTERDYVKCIKDCNHCVMTLIGKVHFNDKKPENKNIYISNIKNGYCMVYKDKQWKLVDRKEQIDDLYEYNEVVLDTWYREYKEKYPEIIKSFERYLKNKNDGEDLLNRVKEQILLMLYNNRIIVKSL